jgi:hypothetical protein
MFDLTLNVMIISSLAFAIQSGFGRKFNYDQDRPESSAF